MLIESTEQRKQSFLERLEHIKKSLALRVDAGGWNRQMLKEAEPGVGRILTQIEPFDRIVKVKRVDLDIVPVSEGLEKPGNRVMLRLEGLPGKRVLNLNPEIEGKFFDTKGVFRLLQLSGTENKGVVQKPGEPGKDEEDFLTVAVISTIDSARCAPLADGRIAMTDPENRRVVVYVAYGGSMSPVVWDGAQAIPLVLPSGIARDAQGGSSSSIPAPV